MGECVFCRIVAGQIPASIVFEDEHTLAFMDQGQVNPGHALVATKSHVENVFGLDDALAAAVFRTTARIARASRAAFGAPGMTLFRPAAMGERRHDPHMAREEPAPRNASGVLRENPRSACPARYHGE
jgi:diadenosine tetraphosphate (Ap4A) HIT family hydrolase